MTRGFANPDVLVTTEWAEQNLETDGVRFVEVDEDTTLYDEGHIPGSVGWDWNEDLRHPVQRDLADEETLEELLEDSGISNDTTVVLYGANNNWFATYAFWLLDTYGHQDLKVIDGGREKWIAEDRPLTKEKPDLPEADYTVREPDFSIRAYRDQVLAALDDEDNVFIDVRSPAEFKGELLAPEHLPQEQPSVPGHIPGALNISWSEALRDDGTFKPASEIREVYESAGATDDKEVIAYCRVGERSSHTWFTLKKLLGYPNVKNYDGSWSEYGSLVDVPVEVEA